jgi:hypothetical protein
VAVLVTSESRFGRMEFQTDQQRLVEDEFIQIFLGKGYTLVTRTDMQAVVKEQKFQRSGLTEDNAVALGKILNVPAVMIVRVTDYGVESTPNKKDRSTTWIARATMGARLISVESGTILWSGKQKLSGRVANRGAAPEVLSAVAKSIANAFPDKEERKP